MRWLLLVGLVGCNQTFGLDHTQVVLVDAPDAAFFDVREDFTCPPIGQTPKFSPAFTTIGTFCLSYNDSAAVGRAIAYCTSPASGPIDGPFVPIASLSEMNRYVFPRLSPEGDRLYVRDNTGTQSVRIYSRTGDNDFTQGAVVLLPDGGGDIFTGVPALGGRMLWGRSQTSAMFDEIVINSDGSIASTIPHTIAELGVDVLGAAPNMTPDGLRITLPGRVNSVSHQMYADRQHVGDPFSTARVLENIPFEAGQSGFMNATCSRIYFKSGTQLVWSQRIE